ncbi:ead/Ea22-like family protein [Salmonella enterica]|nr:ead/Ea22-like family protein [Salmonella enterica]EAX1669480.1 ead/Ea22-like family protein [Salmonella enterica]EAY7915695.1 ead/Ea22-like family protein [Salmonella enterica]QWI01820.1 ead/Ea22-like family protein [Salmonella enterica]
MTALNKQALREAAEKARTARARLEALIDEDVVLFKDDDIKSDISVCNKFIVTANSTTVLALLDENLQLQREKDAIEAVALAMRDDMRQAREQLEAAERRMAEQSAIVAAAEKLVRCKGRYHSELNYRALAKLFGVITPDLPPLVHENVHYAEAVEVEISALRQRIQELEARVIVLPQRLSPEGYHIDEAYMVDDTEGEYLDRDAVIDAIRAADIKVKE